MHRGIDHCSKHWPPARLLSGDCVRALSLPRDICEAEAAELSLLPSQAISGPGTCECPVSVERAVKFVGDVYGRATAAFGRGVGAIIDDDMLALSRTGQIGH